MRYIWQRFDWPFFRWDETKISLRLSQTRYVQGQLIGMADSLGFDVRNNTMLDTVAANIITSSEIEGILLNVDDVRSSVAWQLGINVENPPSGNRYIDGFVEVMMDAVHNFAPITLERLFAWHSLLFPNTVKYRNLTVGAWRKGMMQVVSGRFGKETVHYEAPKAADVPHMMDRFVYWLNNDQTTDLTVKAAIAHLWFVTIHPFSDGNGRIGRALMDYFLAKSDNSPHRLYSMSVQMNRNRKAYYDIIERTQKGNLDITEYLVWFLGCLENAFQESMKTISRIVDKSLFWQKHREKGFNERQIKMINMLWDGFEGKLTSGKWAKIMKCSSDTALRDIQDLISKDVLRRDNDKGRNVGYYLIV